MKKLFSFVMLGAIALAGATMFNSCSSEEAVPVNPTFDGQSVKTAFALNIPYAAQNNTRMLASTTQHESNFRGMTDMYLFPLNFVPSSTTTSTAFPYVNVYLGDLASGISTDQSSKIYTDVSIAVGTNNFLFYAEATPLNDLSTKDYKFANGILTKTLAKDANDKPTNTTTSGITFDLNAVSTSASETATEENTLLGILNAVATVEYGTTPVKWSALTYSDSDTKYQSLVELYNEFTKDNRNGSGPNVLRTMQALYNNVYYIKKGASNSDVIGYCDAIMAAIENNFTKSYDDTKDGQQSTTSPGHLEECYTLAWKSSTDVPALTDEVKDYPKTTFCLPYGAAEIDFDENDATSPFEYSHNTTGVTLGSNLKIEDLCYPASLQYFCNTPAKATNKVIEEGTADGNWPKTTAGWDTDSYWADWTDVVNSSSRSIALRDNIHYGVARLAATVKCANVDNLKDNSKAGAGAEADLDIPINSNGFPVTAFFIGGQSQQVDWQFLPVAGTTRSRIVYDNVMNVTMAAKKDAAVGINYTLVLDNYNSADVDGNNTPGETADQDKVNIAVELTNNSGKDFYGFDGLIRNGQTFYLIGQLDPTKTSEKTGSITWPANTTNGKYGDRFPANGIERVFIQDYTTTANFTIGDLKKAYATIPDLRVAKVQLGLSVDLTWRTGITYDVPLGN